MTLLAYLLSLMIVGGFIVLFGMTGVGWFVLIFLLLCVFLGGLTDH